VWTPEGPPRLRPRVVRGPPHRCRALHPRRSFGYRFITDELAAEHAITASENRVQRLCSSHGISSVLARKKGRGLRPGPAVHDDLVHREFSAGRPNELWLTDITEHPTTSAMSVVGEKMAHP
jgi:putative transposase